MILDLLMAMYDHFLPGKATSSVIWDNLPLLISSDENGNKEALIIGPAQRCPIVLLPGTLEMAGLQVAEQITTFHSRSDVSNVLISKTFRLSSKEQEQLRR